jgi:hypothetical protein
MIYTSNSSFFFSDKESSILKSKEFNVWINEDLKQDIGVLGKEIGKWKRKKKKDVFVI